MFAGDFVDAVSFFVYNSSIIAISWRGTYVQVAFVGLSRGSYHTRHLQRKEGSLTDEINSDRSGL